MGGERTIGVFRAILPDGELDTDAELVAFVPYANLVAILTEEIEQAEDRSIF